MWSDAARAASAEIRRQRAKGKKKRGIRTMINTANARASYEAHQIALSGYSGPVARMSNRKINRYHQLIRRLRDKQAYARQLKRQQDEWGTLPGGQKVFGAGIYRRGR
jgi:hypothetical protein